MPSTLTRFVAGGALALALVGCPTAPSGSVGSVTIVGGDRTLVEESSIALAVEVETTGAASDAVTWSSGDTVVATVDALGTVVALTAGTTVITATSEADPTKGDSITVTVEPSGALRWTRQFGTSSSDQAGGVATDADGNVYVTGHTLGALGGVSEGGADAFIRSYDDAGTHRWTHQFGTSSGDLTFAIATDSNANVYVAGYTYGALVGSNAGGLDVFVRSYDGNGDLRWTRQFGTSNNDYALGVATDAAGNLYIAGHTYGSLEGTNAGSADAYVRSYDADGALRWTRQFGTSSVDRAQGVATDAAGNVYVTGYTEGVLEGSSAGGTDGFVRSFANDGTLRWTRQFGTSADDSANAVATDPEGNVYLAGHTFGSLEGASAGGADAFVRSYDGAGAVRWTRQFGTSGADRAEGVAVSTAGNVYTAGYTYGALEGGNAGAADGFARSFGVDGGLRWTRQFGTGSEDRARGVATGVNGRVYTIGYTDGALEGDSAGGRDAFVRSYRP